MKSVKLIITLSLTLVVSLFFAVPVLAQGPVLTAHAPITNSLAGLLAFLQRELARNDEQ